MSALTSVAVHEHAVLCRHLGGVQDRVSRLMQEKEMALSALTSEVVLLRGQLVVARTCQLWGLGPSVMSLPQRKRLPGAAPFPRGPSPDLDAARKAICQTGCAGHAHPWLTEDGQCSWSGRNCDRGAD